ncbi:MAG: RDD family protein [Bryobacteraceae bacterium]
MRELDGTQLATFTARAVALALDFLLAAALFMGVLVAMARIADAIPSLHQDKRHMEIELNFFHNWYSVVYLVIFFFLSLYWGKRQTLGKRLMSIRVVSTVHHDLSLWHCVERALGYGASALELGFGFLQYFIHPNRRTVHDRIAETIAVKEKRS